MKLFSEFPEIQTKEWEDLILKDLKGQDYSKKLIWNSDEGLEIKPYYRHDSGHEFPNPPGMPGDWNCTEEIRSSDAHLALEEFRIAISKDITAVKIVSIWNGSEVYGVELTSASAISKFIDSIFKSLEANKDSYSDASPFRIYWDTSAATPAYISAWKEVSSRYASLSVVAHFFLDPLSALTVCGEYYNTSDAVWNQVASSIHDTIGTYSIQSVLSVNAINISHAGGNLVQELAFALSMGSEYIQQLINKGISPERTSSLIAFRFSVGSSYFPEIAKFRTFRFLWNRILEAYGVPVSSRRCHIATETTEWNLTVYDPYVNMLRVTTEAMSAILGGSNSLLVHPFDRVYSPGDGFSKRIARNVQHLLRHESYINKVVDPSNGSYYLESLTFDLGEKSWLLFQEIDRMGGYVEALKKEFIQDSIQKVLHSRVESQLNKKTPILGTSQYPNPMDESPEDRRPIPRKTNMNPFPEYSGIPDFKLRYVTTRRASQEFEDLRAHVELQSKKAGKKPSVYLLLAGHKSMRTARAGFATNFMGVIGAEIINTGGTENPEEKIAEIQAKKPEFIVYCSSDEEYMNLVKSTLKQVQSASPGSKILVAGNPESAEELKSLGVQGFIHARSHLYNTLKELFL